MQAFEIIGGVLLILMAIVIIIMVLMQEGKGGGAAALGGAEPQSYGKNRAKTLDGAHRYGITRKLIWCGISDCNFPGNWISSIYF